MEAWRIKAGQVAQNYIDHPEHGDSKEGNSKLLSSGR